MPITIRTVCLILAVMIWILVWIVDISKTHKVRIEMMDAVMFMLVALYLGQGT